MSNPLQEHIHETLESTSRFLSELLHLRLIHPPELQVFTTTRTKLFHRLYSTTPLKTDHLNIMAHELNFMKLLTVRKKQMQIENVRFFGDQIGFVSRLFRRATSLYPEDSRLHISYLNFALEFAELNRRESVKEILARSLQLCPTESDLWVLAAKYWIGIEDEMRGARDVLRRGIEMVGNIEKSESLWLLLLRVELVMGLRIRERGSEGAGEEGGEEEADAEEEELHGSNDDDDDVEMKDDESDSDTPPEELDSPEEALFEINFDEVVNVIRRFSQRTKLLPTQPVPHLGSNSEFDSMVRRMTSRLKIVDVLSDFPKTEELIRGVYEESLGDFGTHPLAVRSLHEHVLELLGQRSGTKPAQKGENLMEVIESFRRVAVCLFPVSGMLEQFAGFLIEKLDWVEKDSAAHRRILEILLREVFGSRETNMTSELWMQLSLFLWRIGKREESVRMTALAVKQFPSSLPLFLVHFRNLARLKRPDLALNLARGAQDQFRSEAEFWLAVIEHRIHFGPPFDVDAIFQKAIRHCHGEGSGVSVLKTAYFDWALWNRRAGPLASSSEEGEEDDLLILVINRILGGSTPLQPYFRIVDTLLRFRPNRGSPLSTFVAEVFRRALVAHGKSSPELWLRYLSFLRSQGNVVGVSHARNEALQTLTPPLREKFLLEEIG